jgi:glycosyltransferase involved in cell wall biosynthesis
MKINLLSHDNGVGLTQDVKIVKKILEKKYIVKFIDLRYDAPERADVNIFFEILDQRHYRSAKKNLFFPNPEWFMWPGLLKGIDLVLCKTHDAERIFRTIGSKTLFTSFTSDDRRQPEERERAYLHTAGQSTTKGTNTVYNNWRKDFPVMIFTKLREMGTYRSKENIRTCFERIPDEIMYTLQNKCIFHLCTSEYEGFGHYIWEAKSCGGIIISTNGPPMNEMVKDFLVKVKQTRRMNFGRLQLIDGDDFQKVIERTMELSDKDIEEMSKASRKSWEENDKYFKRELLNTLKLMI